MLYTFSKAEYDLQMLSDILVQMGENDAVVLWQDGVLQAVKNPQYFVNCPHVFALQNDVQARGLSTLPPNIQIISLAELVSLTEHFSPQIAF